MALKDLVPMVPAIPINRYLWSRIAELDPDLVKGPAHADGGGVGLAVVLGVMLVVVVVSVVVLVWW